MKTAPFKLTHHWQYPLKDYVTALDWSSLGEWLAAASAVGEVVLHRHLAAAVVLRQADGQAISAMAFSADGQFLAAAGQSAAVQVWQVASPEAPALTRPHPDTWIDQLAWHPHRNWLAYGVGSQVQIWAVDQNQRVAELEFASSSVLHLAWHPGGNLLAVSGHGGVKVWDTADWSAEPKLIAVPGASLHCAWSGNGRYLASGNLDRTLTVIKWNSPPPWLMQGFPGKVRQAAWADSIASKTPLLAAACAEGITLWRPGSSDQKWSSQVLQHHQGRVNAIAFQPDHQLLASAGEDGRLCLWHQDRPGQTLKTDSGLSNLAWHPSGFYLATGGTAGQVSVWKKKPDSGRGFGA